MRHSSAGRPAGPGRRCAAILRRRWPSLEPVSGVRPAGVCRRDCIGGELRPLRDRDGRRGPYRRRQRQDRSVAAVTGMWPGTAGLDPHGWTCTGDGFGAVDTSRAYGLGASSRRHARCGRASPVWSRRGHGRLGRLAAKTAAANGKRKRPSPRRPIRAGPGLRRCTGGRRRCRWCPTPLLSDASCYLDVHRMVTGATGGACDD